MGAGCGMAQAWFRLGEAWRSRTRHRHVKARPGPGLSLLYFMKEVGGREEHTISEQREEIATELRNAIDKLLKGQIEEEEEEKKKEEDIMFG